MKPKKPFNILDRPIKKREPSKVVQTKDLPAFNGNSNGSYPNVQRGTYECSKGSMYFRSKWEANYALYLDFLVKNGDIKGWEYEVDTFEFEKIRHGTTRYTPDFKVMDGDVAYHEVKGYLDSRSKTKLRRMAKYFPQIKLVLIERKQYNEILKKLKGVIKFY